MNRFCEDVFAGRVVVALTLCCAAVIAGCGDDAKARITMLEETNNLLLEELNCAREEVVTLRHGGNVCENELAMARGEAVDLNAKLAAQTETPAQAEHEPVSLVPTGWTAVDGGAMITIEGAGLFWPGSVEVRPEAVAELQRIAGILNGELGDREILVVGHTDSEPITKTNYTDNRQISSERALSVTRILAKRGVSPARMIAGACGEHRPRVPNDSETNLAKNRRVEVYALESGIHRSGK